MAPNSLQTESAKDAEVGFDTNAAPWQRARFEGDGSLKRKLVAAAAATFGVLLLVLLCSSILVLAVKTQEARAAEKAASCLMPLGGGETPSGNFPQVKQGCAKALKHYMTHQYSYDVETSVQAAERWFSDAYPDGAGTQDLVVFDIDETVLSNLNDLMRQLETGMPNEDDQNAATAPAIPSMHGLYNSLFSAGFSLAFITGRRESSRDVTERNLLRAGYGEACPSDAPDAERGEEQEPCYVRVDLRADDDARLASVYKPDRRKQLQDQGFQIVACFGDQWSDLAGTSAGRASFKLPNPVYYIL